MRTLLILLATLYAASAITSPKVAATPAEVVEFDEFALSVPADGATVRGILLLLGGPDTRAFITDGYFGAPKPELEASQRAILHAQARCC